MANGWGKIEYAYDAANRMLEAGNRAYGYDANGNLTSEKVGDREALYGYTPENRLSHAVTDLVDPFNGNTGYGAWAYGGIPGMWNGTREVSYTYDALGRRNSRIAGYAEEEKKHPGAWGSYGWDAEQVQTYVYEGTGFTVAGEINRIESKRPDNRMGWKPGESTVGYVYANGALLERRELTGWYGWNTASYYTQDILGSTMQVTDAWGAVKQSYAYDAFGTAYRGDLSGTNAIGYNGKRYDPVLGLYNYGFRDYSPRVGRWTTQDPIRAGSNWYVYVNNSAINNRDLLGLDTLIINMPGMSDARLESFLLLQEIANKWPDDDLNKVASADNPEELEKILTSIDKTVDILIFAGGHSKEFFPANSIDVDLDNKITVYFATCEEGLDSKKLADALGLPEKNIYLNAGSSWGDNTYRFIQEFIYENMPIEKAFANYLARNKDYQEHPERIPKGKKKESIDNKHSNKGK